MFKRKKGYFHNYNLTAKKGQKQKLGTPTYNKSFWKFKTLNMANV